MPTLYWLSVTVHVLAAMLWLGGMFFLGLVGAPVLRAVQPATLRQQLFQQLGLGFRRAGWMAIAILIATGLVNLHYRGLLHWSLLGDGSFWTSTLGKVLAIKLVTVIVMVGASLVHDFIVGPAAGRAMPDSLAALQLRRRAAVLARLNALVGVALVAAAVRLARGG